MGGQRVNEAPGAVINTSAAPQQTTTKPLRDTVSLHWTSIYAGFCKNEEGDQRHAAAFAAIEGMRVAGKLTTESKVP